MAPLARRAIQAQAARTMTSALPPRFPITAEEITLVVTEFYAAIREHPGLGPVFAVHVTDWPAHEDKIARFWRNAILLERGYDGNPLAVHRKAGNVRAPMFDIWLGLFDSVLKRHLRPETAQSWSELAHRIGRALQIGMADRGVPDLH